ncbi:F420-0--gamma-glutamyl ligase [Halovivax asiaticus JCM 14624]|uniref:Coenzyme F420:L-glutamate ligase n=1 Tax=Halovivax asiaticus JCM 14624 TaxID=1227490 RepID=M0BFR7_9EURY|nr:coenzyme F420-0:L-glutamate ligase [Halovivax asiaticus]ELZ09312.1 F420-0--gamma-glutamyl ligase [Halovivax asiaticus JCM 14624]
MELHPVPDLPEIEPGDDLAAMIAERAAIEPGDVVTVASTVVSKAQGRTADLADFPAGPRAVELAERFEALTGEEKDPRLAQAVLEESTEIIVETPFMLTETCFGHTCVNAGIDRSNVPGHDLLLLPKRPADRAAEIRAGLLERADRLDAEAADRIETTGSDGDVPDAIDEVGVVVTDTCGRPFRHGQRGVALGWTGMPASRDWRGETDRDGRELGVTVQAIVDELASAANLVTGEGDDGTPAVVVRDFDFGDHAGGDSLFRSVEKDQVRQALREWSYE